MQFKRAIGIFSVVSSPSRLNILRQLNSRGPLTYSELKAGTGFKAKKESGKFAYHLRKLLRQGLITHNRLDKRYSITPLGRLVLNAAREIDEKALLQTGQPKVRTSKETIEPFHVSKIIQTLVREANISREAAQKIATEIEHVVYSAENMYVTSSKIRELINARLIEGGKEDHRDRLAKLGVSVWDLEEALYQRRFNSISHLLIEAGRKVFKEYVLFTALNKEVVDAHLDGTINITDPGTTLLAPDFVVLNHSLLLEAGRSLLRDLGALLVAKIASMTRYEVAVSFLDARLEESVLRDFMSTLHYMLQGDNVRACVNVILDDIDLARAATNILRDLYPAKLLVTLVADNLDKDYVLDLLLEASADGIPISFSRKESPRTYWGIRIPPNEGVVVCISGVSVNMPRVAYETQGDEIYFKAKLLQVAEKAGETVKTRAVYVKRALNESYSDHLPLSVKLNDSFKLMVNLAGFVESMGTVSGNGIEDEVLRFVDQLLVELSSGDVRVSVTYDPKAGERLHNTDLTKIAPKEVRVVKNWKLGGYTTGYYINVSESLLGRKYDSLPTFIRESDITGLTIVTQSHELDSSAVHQIASAGHINNLTIVPTVSMCSRCNNKVSADFTRCPSCGCEKLVNPHAGYLAP